MDSETSSLTSSHGPSDYKSINRHSVQGDNNDNVDTEAANADTEAANVVNSTSYRNWTRDQWIVLITQCVLILTSSFAYPLLSTFFPQEAAEKGVGSFLTGLIFGIYELVIFFTSPIFGILISRITPRLMCLTGSFLAAGFSIAFGFVNILPDGAIFVTACFAIRIANAVGSSMACVSSMAILSITFPEHTAFVNGIAETMTGIGFMLGPMVGAFLYEAGGFVTPFAVIGGISLIATICAVFQPFGVYEETDGQSTLKVCTLMMNPGMCLIYLHVFGASLALTFLDPIMSQWLEDTFSVSVTVVGLIYFLWSGVYAFSSILMGKLTDMGYIYSLMIFGGAICSISLLFMGPSPLLDGWFPFEQQLWIVCVACVLVGFSCAAMFIPPYMAAVNMASIDSHELNTKAYGIISGLIASAASLGAFAGPTISGYVNENLGFEWSVTVCSAIVLVVIMIMGLYCTVMKLRGKPLAPDTSKPSDSTDANSRYKAPADSSHVSDDELEHLI